MRMQFMLNTVETSVIGADYNIASVCCDLYCTVEYVFHYSY